MTMRSSPFCKLVGVVQASCLCRISRKASPWYRSLGTLLVAAALAARAAAGPVMLPSGEPDPNCPELRLWLRADCGIQDAQGRSPADPDFNGLVATWSDRSPNKFNLAAPPRRAPLFVERQPAAGNRPAVAFAGEQILTRSNTMVNDRPVSTVVLVVQGQPKPGNRSCIYCIGKGQNRREWLGLDYRNDIDRSLAGITGLLIHDRGEREYRLPLTLPSDGNAEGRFAAIISNGEVDRRSLEFHDGLGDLMGGEHAETLLGAQKSTSDKCSHEVSLGGGEEAFFCGQIAEILVFNRGLSPDARRAMLKYLRRRYELDRTKSLLPPGTFLLPAQGFEGNWRCVPTHLPAEAGRYLGSRHVTAQGETADEGIKTIIDLPRPGIYHVWVRALEIKAQSRSTGGSALKTFVQNQELRVTHARGPENAIAWREAGEVALKAGRAEIVVRGEGPGGKDCDAVLISPATATLEAVEDICALAQRIRCVGGESHLTAVFDNGVRLDGSLLAGWRWMGPSGQVTRPDPAAITPLICLQLDRRRAESDRQPTTAAEAWLEFQNGDQMVGTICGYVPASTNEGRETPAQLILRTPVGFLQDSKQTVSVDTNWLRRVVFDRSRRDLPVAAKTLLCRDGRRFEFRAIRWGAESVSALTAEGLARIPLSEIAELRFTADDAWETYYRELSILDPEARAEIVRVDTNDGIIITASTNRSSSAARSVHRQGERPAESPQRRRERGFDSSLRLMQPAWSLEPIPVPWARMRLLWQAPAHMVPLSRFAPQQVTQSGSLGQSWKWQTDRNVAGGILRCEGLDYLWGFGIHAPNEMVFALPDCVRAFRTGVGIDSTVGAMGCVIAKVYTDHAGGMPLFQSKPLVGSGLPALTGEIILPAAAGATRRLVLVTENGTEPHVAGGDPLGIGDHVDWLEPILLLDPAKLHAAVGKQSAR